MINYYKNLPVSQKDMKWGLYVVNAGKGQINLSGDYHHGDHSKYHYFNCYHRRILNEYQFIYIARGSGVFESQSCTSKRVNEGTIIMLFPNEWHRYKPSEETGWDEYWIGFKGRTMDSLVKNEFFSPARPLLHIGLNDRVLNIFLEIIEATSKQKTGYQPLISGALMHLFGMIHSILNETDFGNTSMAEVIVNRALILFRTHIDQEISIQNVAGGFNVSYSWFRKMFKAHTGVSPRQYIIQLKIEKAKILLNDPKKSVKEIAYDLNFRSHCGFSKLFKIKTKVSPGFYREKLKYQN